VQHRTVRAGHPGADQAAVIDRGTDDGRAEEAAVPAAMEAAAVETPRRSGGRGQRAAAKRGGCGESEDGLAKHLRSDALRSWWPRDRQSRSAMTIMTGLVLCVLVAAAHWLPALGWGQPASAGHYIDLASAILGCTLLLLGLLGSALIRHKNQNDANGSLSRDHRYKPQNKAD